MPETHTEELVQARGGRSYYLALVDGKDTKQDQPRNDYELPMRHPRLSSMGSLCARWNSFGALNNHRSTTNNAQISTRDLSIERATHKSHLPTLNKVTHRNITLAPSKPFSASSRAAFESHRQNAAEHRQRRQLPASGALPMGNRSKSSSCLLNVTKPSKYSIYGGFRQKDEPNKPVPRLSYSRAIGPKSKRQIECQSKTVPSRYLKMK